MTAPVFNFKDQAVLVTGSSQNLGLSIARTFAQAQATVILHARSESELWPVQAALQKEFPEAKIEIIAFDQGDERAIDAGFKCLEQRGLMPQVLVNNAAHLGLGVSGFLEQSPAFFREVLEANLFGVFRCSQLAATHMKDHGGGAIVNISSLASERSIHGRSAYNASKAALDGLTRSMALELAPFAIRVNCLALGYVWTERWNQLSDEHRARRLANMPAGHPCSQEEIANLTMYVASGASPSLLGSRIVLDGGLDAQQTPKDVMV